MSILDVVAWVLAPLVGAALGLWMRSTTLALLLGLALVITSFVLFGYSMDHYSNNDCQPGEPCPAGERVIDFINPVFFFLGSTLFLVALARGLWIDFCAGRWPGQGGHAPLGQGRKSD
jgi:hypothetical protein